MGDRIIVIGLGNSYMKDDSLGIRVAELLKQRDFGRRVSVQTHSQMDLTILEGLQCASKVILVDALKGGKEPGTVFKYTVTPRKSDLSQLPSLHSLALHDLLDLATSSGILRCPVVVVGVEPKEVFPGEGLSLEVKSSLPKAIDAVIRELDCSLTSAGSRM